MKQDYTDITIVLDRSGSMSSIKNDMEGGLNQLIEQQKGFTDRDVRFSLVQFDNVAEKVFTELPVGLVGNITIKPRGSTALLDALGKVINDTGDRLAGKAESERPAKTMVVVITDGQENASKEYTNNTINDLVKRQRDQWSWDFVYLGANQDAFAVAGNLGFARGTSMTYNATPAGAMSMSNLRNAKFASYTEPGQKWNNFTQAELDTVAGDS